VRKFNLLLFLFLISVVFAQEAATISGFVRDDATGEPLAYTNVFVKGSNVGSAANIDGYYVLANLPVGTKEVVASIIGYGMVTKEVTVQVGQELRLDFRLKRTVLEGETIDVFGEAQKMRQLVEPSRVTLDMRTLETAPAFVEPDLFRTVQMLPGVQTLNDFSSALYVRGSTPDQNLIMMDGITIYNPYHLGGIFSTFNTDAIKEADFHAGGFPARYGGRMGAILNVINREGNTEKFQGNANVSLVSSKILMEGPTPKFMKMKGSWMVAGRRTYFDQIINALLRAGGAGKEAKFPYYFYDYQIKVNVDLNPDHRLTYSRFYGDDVLEINVSSSEEEYDVYSDYYENSKSKFKIEWPWGNHTNSLTWRWLVNPKLVARTFVANSRYRFHFDMTAREEGDWRMGGETGTYGDQFSFDFFDIIDDRTLETELSWHGITNHQLMGGAQLKRVNYNLGMEFEYSNLDTTLFLNPLNMKDQTMETALFIQDKWDVSSKLAFQVGGRLMDYSLHDELYFDPRFGLKYLLRQDLSLKLALGRYHQFLTIANPEDETLRIIDFWLGLPADRPATYADHAILGVEYLSGKNWLFRAETYYKHFENLITLKQGELFTEETDQVRFTPFNEFDETRAYAYGLELLFKKTAGRIRGWVGYTCAETKRHIDKHGWYYPKYDRKHTLNIVGDVAIPIIRETYFSTALQASSGQPFTPPLGRYEKWNSWHDAYMPSWSYYENNLVGRKNSDRLSSYFRLDIGLKQKKQFFNRPYERFIQLINVTNHVNPLTYQYRDKTNRLTDERLGLERAAVPMFPFFLTFGYRIEF
jgi:hypothetical protein|tara:strand:- start:925 stop:3360 length:2436 start_codon:yes stop_codon:yes gene_type:complete